jgi:hypothetical protein
MNATISRHNGAVVFSNPIDGGITPPPLRKALVLVIELRCVTGGDGKWSPNYRAAVSGRNAGYLVKIVAAGIRMAVLEPLQVRRGTP